MRLPLFLSLLLAACGDDQSIADGEPIVPADAPRADGAKPQDAGRIDVRTGMPCDGTEVDLGTGVRTFIPVVDGDTVYLYRGPQGGYMIYLSVRARGLDPSDVYVCYIERFVSSGEVFGQGCWHSILTNDLGNGWHERVGLWGQVDTFYWTLPSRIRGKDALVKAYVVDQHGCGASDEWFVHISEDPGV